jgi:hypothetical protein
MATTFPTQPCQFYKNHPRTCIRCAEYKSPWGNVLGCRECIVIMWGKDPNFLAKVLCEHRLELEAQNTPKAKNSYQS